MQLYDLHALLYNDLPEGTIINVCELSTDDARLVSANLIEVARALGHTELALEAANDGDAYFIDRELSARFRALIAEYGVETP